jgi:ferredoxin
MSDQRVTVDRIRCDGRGICADLIPELIRLDDWGYPIIDGRPVHSELVEHARRAVANCPVRALRLSLSNLPEN